MLLSGNNDIILGILNLGKKINKIGEIVKIINKIADQTKIIAFNAAIESSTAGEVGKRFSIVAGEIDSLVAMIIMNSTS